MALPRVTFALDIIRKPNLCTRGHVAAAGFCYVDWAPSISYIIVAFLAVLLHVANHSCYMAPCWVQVTVEMDMFAMLLEHVLFLFHLEAFAQEMVSQAGCTCRSAIIMLQWQSIQPRLTRMP